MSIDKFLNVYRAYLNPFIAILGIIGNILVILVFIRKRVSRFNIYSISLLIANSLALLINSFLDDFLGRGLRYATSGKRYIKLDILSQSSCVIMEFLPSIMYFSSGFLMVIFTIDRFMVLTWPFKFKGNGGVKKSIIACLTVYAIGLLTGIPLGLSYKLVPSYDKWSTMNKSCQIANNDSSLTKLSLYYESIIVFVIPTVIILLINSCIIYQIIKMTKIRSEIVVDKQKSRLEMSRLIGMLAVTSSFLLFSIPLSIIIIIRLQPYYSTQEHINALSKLFSSLKDINYSINFFVYFVFLSYFKYDLKMLFSSATLYNFLSSSKSPEPELEMQFKQLQ